MRTYCALVVLFAWNSRKALSAPLSPLPGITFQWGSTKIRGLNIGGWLVLEPWITPSIFENLDQSLNIVDEYTLCERMPEDAPAILRHHWESWTNFDNFQKIATAGFNVVRIPIGYWAYDNTGSPYVSGADEYLRRAVEWARATLPPLKVIIDLHGAPGSQNGYDNSGQRTSSPTWLMDGGVTGPTANQTLRVIDTIAGIYAQPENEDVVIGIELINEPQGWRINRPDLTNYYHEGYDRIRSFSADTVTVISDAFDYTDSWNWVLTPRDKNAQKVAIDHHHYQVFSPAQVARSPAEQLNALCSSWPTWSNADKWTIIGEWTGALTDCAKWLNGYGVGSRFDGTYRDPQDPSFAGVGSCDMKNELEQWDEDMWINTRKFIEAQMDIFEETTQGWFWWNFKTESSPEWDAFALLDAGLFPQPLADRIYAPACPGVPQIHRS